MRVATLVLNRSGKSLWSMLAVAAAVATGLSVYSYLSWLRAQVPISGRLVPMVVAAGDIESGVVVSSSMVELVDHPSRYLPAQALQSIDSVVGRVAAVPILSGEPVTARKVGRTSGASSVIPAGMRAYSLGAQSGVSIAMMPKSGDRVDVMVTFPSEVLGEPTTVTILRSAKVASVTTGRGGSNKVASQLGVPGSNQSNWGITLFVTPEEAERLAMAESMGRVAVVLAPNNVDNVDKAQVPDPVTPHNLGS
jgi:Flp pilus assembly protein CpaB